MEVETHRALTRYTAVNAEKLTISPTTDKNIES